MNDHGQNSACKPSQGTTILFVPHDPWASPFALYRTVWCCAGLYNWHTMLFSPLPWPAWHRGCRPGTIQRDAQNTTEQCFTRFSQPQGPNVPGSDAISGGACLIRLNTPARRQSQTSASPHLGPSVQLPKIMVCIIKADRLPRPSSRARTRVVLGLDAAVRNETPPASGNEHRQWRTGRTWGAGDLANGTGHWGLGSESGKERGWCIEHCRRHAHSLRCPGLARQSQRRIHHDRLAWVLSPPGPITRRPVVRRGVTSLDPFLGISSRPRGNATDCCPTATRRRLLLPQQ